MRKAGSLVFLELVYLRPMADLKWVRVNNARM
ncbi:MAG: hypothetical protein CM15mP59_4600 [Flavobacteriaceae bacterium]|nr:MAG: hypothetical protein CM15mP59_4600 [Flavobacteriaceae bacterium]